MSAKIIDGKAIAEAVREEVKQSVAERAAKGLPVPGLATVIIGDNPASKVYVRMKHKACQEAGILSVGHELPATATQDEVETLVRELNQDPAIHGILVQLPLPAGLDEEYRPVGAKRARTALCPGYPRRCDGPLGEDWG